MGKQEDALNKVVGARQELATLKAERAAIATGKESELSAASKAVEGALEKYFKSSSAKTVDKVDRILGGTENILRDNGSKYNYQSIGSSRAASAFAGPGTLAISHPFLGNNIYLTPLYFNSASEQVSTLLHEPAHLQRVNAFPWHPQAESYGSDIFGLDSSHALNNADNYAQYTNR